MTRNIQLFLLLISTLMHNFTTFASDNIPPKNLAEITFRVDNDYTINFSRKTIRANNQEVSAAELREKPKIFFMSFLLAIAEKADLDIVKSFIEAGVNINLDTLFNPLITAIESYNIPAINLLLEAPDLDVNRFVQDKRQPNYNILPIEFAIKNGLEPNLISKIIDHISFDPRSKNADGKKVLKILASYPEAKEFTQLIHMRKYTFPVNFSVDFKGDSMFYNGQRISPAALYNLSQEQAFFALFIAVTKKADINIIKEFLNTDINKNALSTFGSLFNHAIATRNIDVINLLLEHDDLITINYSSLDLGIISPLELAIKKSLGTEIIEKIIKHKEFNPVIDMKNIIKAIENHPHLTDKERYINLITDKNRLTSYITAETPETAPITRAFSAAGESVMLISDIIIYNNEVVSAAELMTRASDPGYFFEASLRDKLHLNATKSLIEAGININEMSSGTPLLYAIQTKNIDLLNLLLQQNRLDVNKLGPNSWSNIFPLLLAIKEKLDDGIIKKIIGHKSFDPRRLDENGKTLLEVMALTPEAKMYTKLVENKAIEIDKIIGIEALKDKIFHSIAKSKELNLGANNNKDIPTTIRFLEYPAAPDLLKMIVSFNAAKKENILELLLKPVIDDNDSITKFFLINPSNTSKIASSVGYLNTNTGAANIVRFEKQIMLSKKGNAIVFSSSLATKTKQKNINLKLEWQLQAAPVQITPDNPLEKPSVVPSASELSPKKFYPRNGEIPGNYAVYVTNDTAPWARVTIPADVRKKALELNFKLERSSTNYMVTVEPIYSASDELRSFIGKKARKSKNKKTPLVFSSSLALQDRSNENDTEVVLTVETNKGNLLLRKVYDALPVPAESIVSMEEAPSSSEENDPSSDDDNNEGIEVDGPYEALLEDDELEGEPTEEHEVPLTPAAAPNQAAPYKRSKRHEPYFDWREYGLEETKEEKERNERDRNRYNKIILEKAEEKEREELNQASLSSPLLPKKVRKESHKHEIHQPLYLSPTSFYNDCELVKDTAIASTWFGQAYALRNGRLHKINGTTIVLGMKNWQGYPTLGQNASWGSLMATDLGENNYFDGKNVHLSFHEQSYGKKKVQYLNISHHYRFELQKDERSGQFLLYQLEPKATQQIVYVLSQKPLKKEKKLQNSLIPQIARNFINWHPSWKESLNQIIDCEELKRNAEAIKAQLIAQQQELFLTPTLSFLPSRSLGDETHYAWDVFMINHDTGFIALDFIEREQRVTKNFLFNVDEHGIRF